MHNTDPQVLVARKAHQCTWCSQTINPGDTYQRWVTFDDAAFTSKMHPECVPACQEECRHYGGEYTPYENERPEPTKRAVSPQSRWPWLPGGCADENTQGPT